MIDGIAVDAAAAEYLLADRGYDTNKSGGGAGAWADAGNTAKAEPEGGAGV